MEENKNVNPEQELDDDQAEDVAGGVFRSQIMKACSCCEEVYPLEILNTSPAFPGVCKYCLQRVYERTDFKPHQIIP